MPLPSMARHYLIPQTRYADKYTRGVRFRLHGKR